MAAHSSLTMVGRDTELAEAIAVLDDAVSAAEAGTAQRAVLLSGDAGVGKTRLLRALRDHALDAGWQVLAGHCLDFGDSALPYLPFSEVLGRLDKSHPDLVEAVAAVHPALARLQPGRRTRVVGDPADEHSRGSDRGDTLVAVHALLEAAATEAPVLLVVEDLHWADQSTRDMLGFLFTRAFARPVAIVASYRSDDLHRRHPLRRQVAEWTRLPQVGRLALGPLPAEAVRALVHELAPAGLDERSVSRIVERAEGNAFFVEELVASGSCADGDVPGDLADLLLVRLDRLSEGARQVVRVASVAGRRVSHDLLAATADMPADELDAGIRQAVEMNVLEVGGHLYAFRHALLGEAIYDDLLPGERVRLHARYVAALSSGAARGTSAELALHARRANDLDRAVTASIEAGDEAMAVGGPDEAADHYEQALELLEDPDRVARLGVDHARLVVRAANALITGGNAVRAGQLVAARLAQLPPDAAAADRSRLLSTHAEVLYLTETELDPVAVSAEALALAPEGESPLRAKALAAPRPDPRGSPPRPAGRGGGARDRGARAGRASRDARTGLRHRHHAERPAGADRRRVRAGRTAAGPRVGRRQRGAGRCVPGGAPRALAARPLLPGLRRLGAVRALVPLGDGPRRAGRSRVGPVQPRGPLAAHPDRLSPRRLGRGGRPRRQRRRDERTAHSARDPRAGPPGGAGRPR
ncbi:ATP-binding protein [Nocardioides sp. BYT-33-1]|uniref:ATP-binding protein n=1 Tax=Nocardioides sp. BYT-33-1 TaxID=3416952 RepID=UPI003F53CB1E